MSFQELHRLNPNKIAPSVPANITEQHYRPFSDTIGVTSAGSGKPSKEE